MSIMIKNALIFKCYFLRRAHCAEQTPITRVFPSGTHFAAAPTDAMRIKCLAKGHNILMQPIIEKSIAA